MVAEADFPTRFGRFRISGFDGLYGDEIEEAVVLRMGDLAGPEPPLVRIHSQCLTGDVFHSLRCDCRAQLEVALAAIAEEGRGLLIYEHQEGRGIGLTNKIRAYWLQQEEGLDTVEANERLGFQPDLRDYGIGAQIMVDLGIRKVRLMTNNPRKIVALEGFDLRIVERVPLVIEPNALNARYLDTKRQKMGHLLDEGLEG